MTLNISDDITWNTRMHLKWAQSLLRQLVTGLSLWRYQSVVRPIYVGGVVDKVILGSWASSRPHE